MQLALVAGMFRLRMFAERTVDKINRDTAKTYSWRGESLEFMRARSQWGEASFFQTLIILERF